MLSLKNMYIIFSFFFKGTKVAGHRGYFLKGIGVRLNMALLAYGIDFLTERNYVVLQTPFLMNKDLMAATAQLRFVWFHCLIVRPT
jgi:seryl-tRNA synthetase